MCGIYGSFSHPRQGGRINKLKKRYIEFGIKELYGLACLEQAKHDSRLFSPEMKSIKEISDWYKNLKEDPND